MAKPRRTLAHVHGLQATWRDGWAARFMATSLPANATVDEARVVGHHEGFAFGLESFDVLSGRLDRAAAEMDYTPYEGKVVRGRRVCDEFE